MTRMFRASLSAGFTYVELMIVIVIIGVLLVLSVNSYSNARTGSLDQRRRADLEQIRSALEQFRSIQNTYPDTLEFGEGPLTDGTSIYMQTVPQDPQFPARQYFYERNGDDYLLAAELITDPQVVCAVPPGGDACGREESGFGCNFCLSSYGEQ